MNCIKDDVIQKYIDGETTLSEAFLVESHIATCKKCELKIENQRRLAISVKKALNLLAKNSAEIPELAIPSRHIKKPSLTIKRFSDIFAAACILLFVIFITKKKEMKNDDEIIMEIGSVIDVDANRPVSQLPLVISIIDSKGNISEYYIK
jgi:hypothetical protein